MLGVYDYTVILTYLSAISAVVGVFISTRFGNLYIGPYLGCLFLLFCGLLDAFDGKVARTKKNRTDYEKKFGIQIDSLTDLLAFGVLPSCIGYSMIKNINQIVIFKLKVTGAPSKIIMAVYYFIMVMYVLNALIRLANFNVVEEERQNSEEGNRKYFQGVPVTTACFVFPIIMLIQYLTDQKECDISIIYFTALAVLGMLFTVEIKIPKFQTKQIIIVSILSVIILVLVLVKIFLWV